MVYKAVKADTKGLTDRGKVREVNEDQFLIASLHKVVEVEETSLPQDEREQFHHSMMARLLLVADGVGGSAAGEKASGLALKTITSYVANTMQCFYRLDVELQDDLLDALETSVRRSHAMVLSMAQETTEYKGMATTLTMAHILWPRAYIVQVGDSRCYLGRGSDLTQVTKDQTVAQDLVDDGVISVEAAERTPYADVLSSAVGAPDITPVTSMVELERGDDLLLCTDGLTKHVPNDMIAELLVAAESAEQACHALVAAALDGGGSDNVTVVVCRFR